MEVLDLNSTPPTPPKKLSASAFPERADIYTCDVCGRDITKHLRPGRAHVWSSMGPERYICKCGQTYLTGAREWDHLGDWQRSRRIRETLVLGILFSLLAMLFGLLPGLGVYLISHKVHAARLTVLVIAAIPLAFMLGEFYLSVGFSIYRTRFRWT